MRAFCGPVAPNEKISRRAPNYRFVDGTSRGATTPAVAHYDRGSHHPKGLVKQAYSALVSLSPHTKTQKWHLTAYFSYDDLEDIPTVDQDPMLQRITVPAGIFRNGKARAKDNTGSEERCQNSDTTSSTSSPPPSPLENKVVMRASNDPVILPPLRATISDVLAGSPQYGRVTTRPKEDQRLIHILNSRHIR